MKDNDIIQALKCCTGQNGEDACVVCPFINTDNCMRNEKLALDLINRQKAEIQKLQIDNKKLTVNMNAFGAGMKRLAKDLKNAKAEAIKEFAERLKECAYQSSDWSHGEHPYVVEKDDIDRLVEEMLGEQE